MALSWYTLLVAGVAAERGAELVVARRNLAWSRARGGIEVGFGHYPVMVLLHTAFLISWASTRSVSVQRRWAGWPCIEYMQTASRE